MLVLLTACRRRQQHNCLRDLPPALAAHPTLHPKVVGEQTRTQLTFRGNAARGATRTGVGTLQTGSVTAPVLQAGPPSPTRPTLIHTMTLRKRTRTTLLSCKTVAQAFLAPGNQLCEF